LIFPKKNFFFYLNIAPHAQVGSQSLHRGREGVGEEGRRMVGVKPGTTVRVNPGSWKKMSDHQDLVIFNQARKKSWRSSISQEGRLKRYPSFTSLLQNNLFRETVFSLLQ
jgi:hypothetical protein